MHEGDATAREPTLENQGVPCGDEDLRNGRGVGDSDGGGNRQHLPLVHGEAFGVGAAPHDAHHLVADLPERGPLPHRRHSAGVLHAGDLVGGRWPRVVPAPLQQIGAVERGGHDVDDDLLRPRRRIRNVLDREDLRTSVRVEHDGAHHDLPNVSWNSSTP